MSKSYNPNDPKKVYIISNINPNRHSYIDYICSYIKDSFTVFKPHIDNKYNLDNAKIEYNTFFKDKEEINNANICLVLLPLFGRDSASEIGYGQGRNKCLIAFIRKMETPKTRDWLNDWMVKGFIDYYITDNKKTYELVNDNPLIYQEQKNNDKKSVYYINSLDELSCTMEIIYEKWMNL